MLAGGFFTLSAAAPKAEEKQADKLTTFNTAPVPNAKLGRDKEGTGYLIINVDTQTLTYNTTPVDFDPFAGPE
ncbi:unnamed protein product, partial [Didymodactylos carnosus]